MATLMNLEPNTDDASRPNQDRLRERSGTYHFFSRMMLNEVDMGLLTLMRQPQFMSALGNLSVTVPNADEFQLEQLAIDYCRIFIGPQKHAPPYQSVWLDGQMQSACSESMKEYLEIIGRVEPESTMDDHFGIQLSVMSRILNAASMMEDPEEFERLARAFFIEHVAWSTRMLSAAISRAQTDFYKTILESIRDFIESEAEISRQAIPMPTEP